MGNIVFNQAAKFLQKRRNTRRWIAVVLCLALVITSGTFSALTRHGSALTGKGQILACTYKGHVHGEECYNEAGELVCGYADYCVHEHNEDCYDSEGNLVCQLPEISAHVHDDSCYVEEEQLICGLEENEIHQHTDDCYDVELEDLVCELEEHVHDDSCYELITEDEGIPENSTGAGGAEDEAADGSEAPVQSEAPAGNEDAAQNGEPAGNEDAAQSEEIIGNEDSAQNEEPVADDDNVQDAESVGNEDAIQDETPSDNESAAQNEEPVQSADSSENTAAQNEEAAEGTEAVQSETPVESAETEQSDVPAENAEPAGEINECAESRRLVCELEEHIHGNECYIQNKVLKCGKMESAEAHVHSTECYEVKQAAKCGQLELHTHSEECYTDGVLTCGKLELVEHIHSEDCFKEAPVMELTATAGDVTITVSAEEEGIIPAGAELSVTPVVKTETENLDNLESEEERAEAEALNAVYDEIQQGLEATVEEDETKEIKHFLAYDISFHTQNENGEAEEVKLNGDVNVTLEFPQGALPEDIISDENAQIDSVDVLDMKETEEGRIAEAQDAVVDTTQDVDVEKVETTLSDSSTIAIAWIGEINPETGAYVYEDDDVVITVTPLAEDALPENAKLQVVPILPEKDEEQYQQVMDRLAEKAEEEKFQIAGFLAYDISFLDEAGSKIEPEGRVKVAMEYRNAIIPEEVKYFGSQAMELDAFGEEAPRGEEQPEMETSITVMHLEEDEAGEVTQVVDMGATGDVKSLEATENQEVQKAEFETESFSTFVITWTVSSSLKATITVYYVDENGEEIPGSQTVGVTGSTSGTAVELKKYATELNGYTFNKITVDSVNGTQISQLRRYDESGWFGLSTTYYIQCDSGSWNAGNWNSSGSNWTKWKTISSNTTGNVYIVYSKNPESAVTGGTLGAPDHNKYIEYNEEEDDYTLTLDVTGKRGTASGIDVLFVIDKSGSMGTGSGTGYYNLLPTLRTTVENIVPTIVPEGTVNKVAAVSFSSNNYSGDIATEWNGYTTGTNPVTTAVNGLTANGGTNWQLAMRRANNKLAEVASDNNQKIVIFLSDGAPTHYFADTSTSTSESSGNSDTAASRAVNEVNRSTYLKAAKVYSVYLNNDTKSSMTSFATSLKNIGVDAAAIDGTDLNASLTELINSIVTPAYTEMVIEDELSEYVDFAEASPTFTVNYKKTDKDTGTVTEGTLDQDKYEITYPVGSDAKKFTITFKDGTDEDEGVLDPDTTYSISFKIKTTEAAEASYRENDYQYPMTGDDGTDAPGNTTSSGQGGFYSNESAVIKYKENGDEQQKESEYPHPVVQVNVERPIESYLNFDKTATVRDWDERTYDINITAASTVTSTTTTEENRTADIMMVFDVSGSMNFGTSSTASSEASFSTTLGQFKNVSSTLDTTKLYYYGNTKHSGVNGSSAVGGAYPMIYLAGKWQYYSGSSWVDVPANSTTSIYTFPSRLTALKEAATTFVTSTAAASPNSKIGVATFSSTGSGNSIKGSGSVISGLATVGSNPDNLVKTINQIYAGGGTYINAGLSLTETPLKNAQTSGIPQYVILFCDGASDSTSDQSDAKATAERLKAAGVTVYTIGFGLSDTNATWLQNNIASPGCALTANNTDDLGVIFESIKNTITANLDIKNVMVKDVIDPRFVILDDSGKPIVAGDDYTEEQIKDGVKLSNGGTVYLDDDGNQFIAWNEQTIPSSSNGSWSETITVKAKEEYIGGNNVPTNISPDSTISTGYGDAVLPQPTVNVKAELKVDNNEVTIYKGDTVPTDKDILDKLFKKEEIAEKYGLDEEKFKLEWYEDKECIGKEISKDKLSKVTPEEDVVYYLKVTYMAEEPTEKSNKNTTKDGKTYVAGISEDGNYNVIGRGAYEVKVISGEIDIIKELTEVPAEDTTFTFVVSRLVEKGVDSADEAENQGSTDERYEEMATATITVEAGETEGILTGESKAQLQNLPRGTYKIEEMGSVDYVLNSLEKDAETDCESVVQPEFITFKLGYDEEGKDVITDEYTYSKGGLLGKAVFTNEAVIGDLNIIKRSSSSDTSIITLSGAEFELKSEKEGGAIYFGESQADGTVKWFNSIVSDEQVVRGEALEDGEKLQAGTYTLKETKSPAGYGLSEESWTIEIASNGKLKSIISSAGPLNQDAKGAYYYDNEAVYALPSTGGEGIYWYSIGGTLLMMAGALILYRNKNKRVRRCRRA